MRAPLPIGPGRTPAIDMTMVNREGKIGIAYSGGGDRIAVHVGIVQAFIEMGIIPQHIAGSSAGAFASVFHALEPHALTYLPLVTRTVQRALPLLRPSRGRLIFQLLPSVLWGLIFGSGAITVQSLNSDRGIRHLLKRSLPVRTIGELGVPVSIAATNLLTGSEQWFESADTELVRALLASSAVPALFPPAHMGGELYLDGTIADNLPLFHLAQLGCSVIYACNVGYAGERTKPPANLLDTLLQAEGIGQYVADMREQELLALLYPQIKVIPVRPIVELQRLPSDIRPADVPGSGAAAAAEAKRILTEAAAPSAPRVGPQM